MIFLMLDIYNGGLSVVGVLRTGSN